MSAPHESNRLPILADDAQRGLARLSSADIVIFFNVFRDRQICRSVGRKGVRPLHVRQLRRDRRSLAALNEGRSLFPSDEQFGQWASASGVCHVGTHEIDRHERMTRKLPARVARLLPARTEDVYLIEPATDGFRVAMFWRRHEVGEKRAETLAEAHQFGAELSERGFAGFVVGAL